jgi:hypothetical protein
VASYGLGAMLDAGADRSLKCAGHSRESSAAPGEKGYQKGVENSETYNTKDSLVVANQLLGGYCNVKWRADRILSFAHGRMCMSGTVDSVIATVDRVGDVGQLAKQHNARS